MSEKSVLDYGTRVKFSRCCECPPELFDERDPPNSVQDSNPDVESIGFFFLKPNPPSSATWVSTHSSTKESM